jgi:TRAP-type C4-dicarboxylate transport system permease small subunit
MNNFANTLRRIIVATTTLGGISLALLMVFTVANVIGRLLRFSILGFMEISVFLIIVAAACALAYTTWEQGHVVVTIVVDRLSQLPRRILGIITSLISLSVIAFIAWASVGVLRERWLREISEMHDIPFLPFRIIFVFSLVLFGLVLLIHTYKWLKEGKLS